MDSTSLHVPDLGLIVSGDVAYNHCHMYVATTTPGSRAEWIAALDKLTALSPAAVVTGLGLRVAKPLGRRAMRAEAAAASSPTPSTPATGS